MTWTNEIMPIKQGAPVVIALFGGFGYIMLLFVGFMLARMDVRFLRVYGLFCGDKSDTVCVYLSVVTRKRSCPLFDFMKKREF